MARKAVKFNVDLSGWERHVKASDAGTRAALDTAFTQLSGEGEDYARELVDWQIYETPERGYERTQALRRSIYAFKIKPSPNKYQVLIGAIGGAGGRAYALFNERGTYGGRITLQRILKDAIAVGPGLILLEYGEASSGLEPRPFTIPAAVMVFRQFPNAFLVAVRTPEKTQGPLRAAAAVPVFA